MLVPIVPSTQPYSNMMVVGGGGGDPETISSKAVTDSNVQFWNI
jgi:hypothetical protein